MKGHTHSNLFPTWPMLEIGEVVFFVEVEYPRAYLFLDSVAMLPCNLSVRELSNLPSPKLKAMLAIFWGVAKPRP